MTTKYDKKNNHDNRHEKEEDTRRNMPAQMPAQMQKQKEDTGRYRREMGSQAKSPVQALGREGRSGTTQGSMNKMSHADPRSQEHAGKKQRGRG